MFKFLLTKLREIGLVVAFTLMALPGWTQVFQNGIRQGIVKVKFSPTVAASLSVRVDARSGKLNTGIASFDAIAKTYAARTLYRLFPATHKNANKLHKHSLDQWYIVEINESADPVVVAAQFKTLPEVLTAEVDHEEILSPYQSTIYTPGATTLEALPFNDPLLKDQWHYNNTGQAGVGEADVNLFEAWKTTAGANDIIVSIHDQGIDVAHKDLRANMWVNTAELNGLPGKDDDNNGYVDDINGYNFQKNKGAVDPEFHGTHVGGTVSAVNNNGIGVAGVAGGTGNNDGVKLMSLQIFGGLFENSYIYAADNGAVISQNSWGYSNPNYYDQSVLDAIDYFIAEAGDYPGSPMKGGIVIFAAGNSNSSDPFYPAYHPKVLAVASVGPEFIRAPYSNFGDWVEIASIGGDQSYGTKAGVLSTTPKDQYAYIQGTSMACPHVSGIAALALANRDHQLTNTELWMRLVTGVVNIEAHNADFAGQLGSGMTDAALAIQNNLHVAPDAINSLAVTGIAQEFATLSWNVPSDGDDGMPTSFQLYYSMQPISENDLGAANKIEIRNEKKANEVFAYEVAGLIGLRTYYFAITSTDRWGNVSAISNVRSETTNDGPAIAVDEGSQFIDLTIDVSNGMTTSHDITISNNAAGILRWTHFLRHKTMYAAFNTSSLHYPSITKSAPGERNVTRSSVSVKKDALRSSEPTPMSFTPVLKEHSNWPTDLIGETDLSLPNSSATRFNVTEAEGFNLTMVRTFLRHDPAKGPVILEIYKGESPVKSNLIFAQEYNAWSSKGDWAYMTLNEQLYFASGETFWVVMHVPPGNLFPLSMGFENDPLGSKNCLISFDLGANWTSLELAINDKGFAWAITAFSDNAPLGNYITLDPGAGDVSANSENTTTLIADASTLINGSYEANMVIASNDGDQKELRIPIHLTVTGHQPNVKHVDIANFETVFVGESKTLDLVLDNQGLGNFSNLSFETDNANFAATNTPWQIGPREQAIISVTLTPNALGNINGILKFTDGTHAYEISLFGVGAETSKIAVTPSSQTKTNIAIGNVVSADITVENIGAFPLKYFVPGFDTKGVSDNWPSPYHRYGYKVRTNEASDHTPIAYAFQDISATGTDITSKLVSDRVWYTVDMGFDFPYYGDKMQTLYVAQKGFTAFDDSMAPLNIPSLYSADRPLGIISVLSDVYAYELQGKIFYQVEADRVIVQYDHVVIRGVEGSYTAQMVLFMNGDIRFYYDHLSPAINQMGTMSILIDSYNKTDGISFSIPGAARNLFDGMAVGFDYPGPNIIQSIDNGSGILAPGQATNLHVVMNTNELSQGLINRTVNIISNDPSAHESYPLVQLSINRGGTAKPHVSVDTVLFGDVFKGDNISQSFVIKNNGTANVRVISLKWVNSKFNIVGSQIVNVGPGLYRKYSIGVPTTTLGLREDWLSINYADGTHDTIYVTANVVAAPSITVDLSTLNYTLAQGDSLSVPLTVTNTGAGTLEFSATGKQWLSFDAPATPADITYTYEKENKGDVYHWIDIRKTGTQLPFMQDHDMENTFWRKLTLPFPVEFYGEKYTQMNVGDNGIIAFEENPPLLDGEDRVPTTLISGPCIMPYWTFSGFSTMDYPIEEIGIFYQYFDDHIIITWSLFRNRFSGRGEAVSAQIIFYKNGTLKFQYKPVDADLDFTSQLTIIGLQKDSATGISISEHKSLDFGQGLAYVLMPTKKFAVLPGASLAGAINLDARNVYGGIYQESLQITTNVPGKRTLEKPVELTVTGQGVFAAPDSIDFGTKLLATEFGWPVVNTTDLIIRNDGNKSFDITWAKMIDGTQALTMLLEVDGWMGKEWTDITYIYTQDATETPTYTLLPGDELKVMAAFYPSVAGDFNDELIITTSIGDQHIKLKGSGLEPPVLSIDNTPIVVNINRSTDTDTRTIDFNNIDGASDLKFLVGIEYLREPTQVVEQQTSDSQSKSRGDKLNAVVASSSTGEIQPMNYTKTISHTTKTVPDTFIGNGGSVTTLATKYNAGPDGFNITHVETFMRAEQNNAVKLEVAIRAGGTGILNSPIIATGTLEFTSEGIDNTGAWRTITLDKPVLIYPNEDFYVSVTYPFGIEHAQGSIKDSPTVQARYLYENEGYWFDVQNIGGLENIGWLMYAAEQTTPSWLTITSETEGTVEASTSSSINLLFHGDKANQGNQFANLKFATNDPYNPVVSIPVTLHLNEGPLFNGGSTTIIMEEGEVVTLNFNITDKEGHTFAIAPKQNYERTSYTLNNSRLTITFSPDYEDAGNHTYVFEATDEFGATSALTLYVEVMNTNQPPVYAGDEQKTLDYHAIGKLFTYDLADYFTDPEGDAMTFTVINGNTEIADVFASGSGFIVMPLSIGETTLAFVVRDDQGGITLDTLQLNVNSVLAIEAPSTADVVVFPNKVNETANVVFSTAWNGEVMMEMIDATGRRHLTQNTSLNGGRSVALNVSSLRTGMYILRIASKDKIASIKLVKE